MKCIHHFDLKLESFNLLCLNTPNRGSRIFKSIYDNTKYDGMLVYCFDGKQWLYSLYTDNKDIDLSVVAKKFGGGGHSNACGFVSDKLPHELVGIEKNDV